MALLGVPLKMDFRLEGVSAAGEVVVVCATAASPFVLLRFLGAESSTSLTASALRRLGDILS